MTVPYRVDLTIGPDRNGNTHTWTVHRGDPPTEFPILLDGLTVGWVMPPANIWPTQPQATLTGFSILAESAADLDGIDLGTPILLRIHAGLVIDGTPHDTITLPGRITDLTGTRLDFTHPVTGADIHGWRLDLIAACPLATLAETAYGYRIATPPGGIGIAKTLGQIIAACASAGIPAPDWGNGAPWGIEENNPGPVDTVIGGPNLLEHLASLLQAYPDSGEYNGAMYPARAGGALYATEGWRRGLIQPNTDANGVIDPDTPYKIDWVSRRQRLDADQISADYVDTAAQWVRNKLGTVNVAHVPNQASVPTTGEPEIDWQIVTDDARRPGEAPVTVTLDNRLKYRAAAVFLAEMYLDDPDSPPAPWTASGFKWHASKDPAWTTFARSLFPGADTWAGYAKPLTVVGIPASQHPMGQTAYSGVVTAATLTFAQGEFTIDITLRPCPDTPPKAP